MQSDVREVVHAAGPAAVNDTSVYAEPPGMTSIHSSRESIVDPASVEEVRVVERDGEGCRCALLLFAGGAVGRRRGCSRRAARRRGGGCLGGGFDPVGLCGSTRLGDVAGQGPDRVAPWVYLGLVRSAAIGPSKKRTHDRSSRVDVGYGVTAGVDRGGVGRERRRCRRRRRGGVLLLWFAGGPRRGESRGDVLVAREGPDRVSSRIDLF